MVVEERGTDADIVPVDIRSAVDLPFRLGFAIAGVALTAAESAVTIARVTATSVQHEIGQAIGVSGAELGGARAPLALLAQLSDLMSPDRPLGRLIAPGGPLERLVTPGGVVDRLTAKDGLLEKLTAPGGIFDQITDENGILVRLTAKDGPLDRLTRPGGVVDQFTENEGILERLTSEGGIVDQLTAPGGLLDKATEPGGALDRLATDGGLRVIEGNLGRGVVKVSAVAPEHRSVTAPARCFDDQHDLALLKVGVPAGTPFFPLAAQSPGHNDPTLVIGNGDGAFLRPSTGRLLSLDAQAGRADFPPGTLELSVPLVPGDSGGPVINAKGEAVGVVSYISLNPRNRKVTSYAVPVTLDNQLLADLRAGVKNEAPLIGITTVWPGLTALNAQEFAEANRILKLGLGDTPGAFFTGVSPGSPAEQAGLKPMRIDEVKRSIVPGDVVTAVNGKRILNFSEFQYAVREHRPGETVTLTVLREGKEIKLNLTLAPRSRLHN